MSNFFEFLRMVNVIISSGLWQARCTYQRRSYIRLSSQRVLRLGAPVPTTHNTNQDKPQSHPSTSKLLGFLGWLGPSEVASIASLQWMSHDALFGCILCLLSWLAFVVMVAHKSKKNKKNSQGGYISKERDKCSIYLQTT